MQRLLVVICVLALYWVSWPNYTFLKHSGGTPASETRECILSGKFMDHTLAVCMITPYANDKTMQPSAWRDSLFKLGESSSDQTSQPA